MLLLHMGDVQPRLIKTLSAYEEEWNTHRREVESLGMTTITTTNSSNYHGKISTKDIIINARYNQ